MLQYGVKSFATGALAFAAYAGLAVADSGCDLSDGYKLSPAAFSTEAEACLEGVDGIAVETWMESEIRRQTLERRSSENLEHLDNLSSLNEAARLHAMDMVARQYAAHNDHEGRTHLDRVRILDRQRLIGASGANLVVLPASNSPAEAFAAMMSDEANAGNVSREAFTHMGVGAASDGQRTYVVQLFARVDGALDSPLPLVVNAQTNLAANYSNAAFAPVGWRLESVDGETVASGLNERLYARNVSADFSRLNIDVAYGNDTYTLKGPIVSLQ